MPLNGLVLLRSSSPSRMLSFTSSHVYDLEAAITVQSVHLDPHLVRD